MATVLLYADEPILAEGLWRLLENISGIDMVDCCHGLESLRGRLAFHQPDILLADLTEDFTYAVLSSLRGAVCSSRIVLWVRVISTELASQSLSLGIRGILRRTLPADTLIRCLTRVNEGELWFDTTLTDSMMTVPGYSLTRRESQLVAQLSQGLKNKEIAKALNIAAGTVKVYMSRLFKKVGVKDRFELALYGLRNLKSGSSATEALSMGSAVELQSTPLWQPASSLFVERMPVASETRPLQKLSRRPC